jgi:hypothetical protein
MGAKAFAHSCKFVCGFHLPSGEGMQLPLLPGFDSIRPIELRSSWGCGKTDHCTQRAYGIIKAEVHDGCD